jgi:hypothetical protein
MLYAIRSVWVVAAFAMACGEVKTLPSDLPDASLGDGGTEVDAPPAFVRVRVLNVSADGLPDTMAKVVYQDPDGNVALDGAVDVTGRAEAALPRGGLVTAIRITENSATSVTARIDTTLGVKPGDDLTLGPLRSPQTRDGGQTSMTASFTPMASATGHTFYTACSQSSTATSPVTLLFRDSCHGAAFDLLATASRPAPARPGFLKLTSINYQAGGSFSVPGVFTEMANFAVNMTNVPDAISSMRVRRDSMLGNLTVAPQFVDAGNPPAGSFSVPVPYPQGFGTRSEVAVTMNRADAQSTQVHEARTTTLGTSIDLDLGNQLPWFTDIAQTRTGGTWRMIAAGRAPDGMLSVWFGRWMVGTVSVTVIWSIVGPPEMTGFVLPELPPAYAMLDPGRQTGTVELINMVAIMADFDNLAGYDELRPMAYALLNPPIGSIGAFLDIAYQRRVTTLNAR